MRQIKPNGPQSTFATPEDGAAYWFAREQSAELTRQESEAREGWLSQSTANRKAYERASALWGGLDALAAHEEIRKLRRTALDAKPPVQSIRHQWRFAAAACLVVALAGGYWLSRSDHSYPLSMGSAVPNTTHFQTAVGERSTVTLKDGSVVALNTASELWVRFNRSERVVELTRGQAYFSVAQEPRHPFVVMARGQRITALGTAFDVRLDRDQVQVVLVEGRVAVNPATSSVNRIELEPGERFVSRDAVAGRVSKTNVEAMTSWRSGRIVFTETSVADALAEVNRYRERPIVIGDVAVGSLKISGTYRISEAEHFPQALAAYYPLELKTRASGETVLLWRQRVNSN